MPEIAFIHAPVKWVSVSQEDILVLPFSTPQLSLHYIGFPH